MGQRNRWAAGLGNTDACLCPFAHRPTVGGALAPDGLARGGAPDGAAHCNVGHCPGGGSDLHPPGVPAAVGEYCRLLLRPFDHGLHAEIALWRCDHDGDLPDVGRLSHTLARALQAAWALILPGAVGLVALGPSAVAFLLQRGAFDGDATALVYTLLVIFAIRLVAETTQDILFLPFYAGHNTRTPMWVAIGWMLVNVTLSYRLVGPFGIQGLALASTLAVVLAVLALYALNRTADNQLGKGALGLSLGRALLASLGMATVVLAIRGLALATLPYLTLAIAAGGAAYMGCFLLLGGRAEVAQLALALPSRRRAS
ncbi:MAG: polysaccharide biosynthesis C-terminal domain-containing protein [Caldilineaceae bacterium]|nr:polysaccharide biosynthesis C-terminal domain-containing protein [Caldilineaceae bacterium]